MASPNDERICLKKQTWWKQDSDNDLVWSPIVRLESSITPRFYTLSEIRMVVLATTVMQFRLEMHNEIFHFEIFKNFMKILKYFKTPFLKYFMKLFILNIKWLKTFKNMIKVYQSSRRYIMLFMHNDKYLPLTGLLTSLQWTIHNTACIVLHPAKYFDIYGVKWLKKANQASRPADRLRELQYA